MKKFFNAIQEFLCENDMKWQEERAYFITCMNSYRNSEAMFKACKEDSQKLLLSINEKNTQLTHSKEIIKELLSKGKFKKKLDKDLIDKATYFIS